VDPRIEGRRVYLRPEYSVSRVIVGGWQFSRGHGGGIPDGESPVSFLSELVSRGFTTFDCADIYTGVEEMLGEFLGFHRSRGSETPVQIHTKFVPDLEVLTSIDRRYAERIIHRSLRRLGVETLDLVQFHWWDFAVPGYVEVMGWLDDLKTEGKIRHLGVTNFDEEHLVKLVEEGAEIISNQVQYSVLDRRPEKALVPYCMTHGISLLCYGALAGGFLTDGYLGRSEPPGEMENRSLVKYRLIIGEVGGWPGYRRVMEALHDLAARAKVSLATVALRYVLDRPGVAATITGIDTLAHADQLRSAMELILDPDAWEVLDSVLSESPIPPGPVYGLERDRLGPHGSIMRYNLNQE